MEANLPGNEGSRLAALASYQILDTLPEQTYDDLTRLASMICDAPMALITLIDEDRQWIKSRVGLDVTETDRAVAFCAHTILQPQEMLIVPDARQDLRFADNPFVQGEPHVRFYAGVPLVTPEGHAVGSLCVVDTAFRQLTPPQQEALQALARQVMVQLELRRNVAQLEHATATRQQAEQQMREREERFRSLIQYGSDMIGMLSAEGTYLYVSPAVTPSLGYQPEELVGQNASTYIHPSDLPHLQSAFEVLLSGEQIEARQFRFRAADGEWRWIDTVATNMLQHPGVEAIVVNSRDVTQRKQIEQSLHHERDFISAVVNTVGSLIVVLNIQGEILQFNRACEELTGYSFAEVRGKKFWDVFLASDDLEAVKAGFVRLSRGDFPSSYENDWVSKDGKRVPIAWSNTALLDAQGGVEYVIGTGTDITERNRAQVLLLKANDELELHVRERTAELGRANELLRVENIEHQMTMETLREFAAALQTAKEEADAANAAKSEFLSRMSHELRTPLNAILGFGQILDRQELTPLQKEGIDHILKGGRHLLALINEVLDIARVEAGAAELSIEPVKLEDVVTEACALVQPLAHQSQIRFENHLFQNDLFQNPWPAQSIPHVMADRQRLRQVLLNLLSNAIKYNNPGGKVVVSARETESGRVQIRVQDSGWGLSALEVAKLFTPFERLQAIHTGIEGTGLGLVISQRLTTAMGGTLGVESEVGRGSTFWIELPPAQAPLQALSLPLSGPPPADFHQLARTYVVLNIEDNVSNLRLTEAILASRPEFTLLGAMQGNIGLDMARQHHPDVILLDLHLPGLSGREVLERLQQDEATKNIPVIVVSTDATAKQIERLLAAGAVAYLTKPLDVAAFLNTIDEVLQKDN